MALNFPRAAPPQIFRKFGKFDAYAPDPLLVAMPPLQTSWLRPWLTVKYFIDQLTGLLNISCVIA